jgi:flagellar biosynthesis/type III secretory pathway protein FliH
VNYSTFARQVAKVESAKVKEGLMTIAEELIEKGRQEGQQEGWQKGQQEGWQKGQQEGWQKGQQEGLERGRIIGRIQTFQDLLNLPLTSVAELSRRETAELQALLLRLEAELRGRSG